MEIRVNVINEMTKLRKSTYSDRLTWIDEVIQNCQRSNATHIDVQVDYDSIIISDNGCGCTDPHVLFDKSSSGWSDEVTTAENPFGEGFFSTMMAANTIEVKSVGFNAVFDVKKMFETNNVDAVTVTPNRKQSGFTLILSDLLQNVCYYDVIDRFKKVGRYIKSPTITLNGEHIPYEGLEPKDNNPFIHKFNTPLFRGWIVPDTWSDARHCWSEEIKVKCFAFSRLIKDSDKFGGVRGVVSFKENAVTLRSPDRKDFVYDDLYETALDSFYEEIKKMYLKLIKFGSDDDISHYESYIKKYVDMADYRKHIRFHIMEEKKEQQELIQVKAALDMSEPADNTDIADTDDSTNTFIDDDFDTAEDNADKQASDTAKTDPFTTDIKDSPITNIPTATVAKKMDFEMTTQLSNNSKLAAKPAPAAAPAKQKSRTPVRISAQTGESIDTLTHGFYLKEHEQKEYKENIEIAQHYHIPIILLRNALEEAIVLDDSKFSHISEMEDMISLNAEYKNTEPQTEQEERAVKLLSRMARAMNLPEDMFIIADTQFQKVLTVSDGSTHVIENIDVIATACNEKIYINRNHMTAYKDLNSDSSVLTPADIKFLLVNAETLAHEMAHAVYHTTDNTKEHAEKTIQIMNQMIHLIYGNPIQLNKGT